MSQTRFPCFVMQASCSYLIFLLIYHGVMSTSADARNVPPKLKLSCHPKEEFNHVVCLLCDSAYYKSEFDRKASKVKGFYISNSLGVYSNHDITYKGKHVQDVNNVNFDKTKVLKLKCEIMKFEIMNDSHEQSVNTGNSQNKNDNEENHNELTSSAFLISENKNLKKLVNELTISNEENIANNKFLRKTLETNNAPMINNNNYTQAVLSDKFPKVKKPVPAIIIKKGSIINKEQLMSKVKRTLSKDSKIQVDNIIGLQDKVIIKCHNETDIDSAVQILEKLDKKDATVSIEQKLDPRIKVINIEQEFGEQENEYIIADIQTRNNLLPENKLKIISKYKNKNNTWSLIIEVNSENYANIMKEERLYVGADRCMVYDNIYIKMCTKCSNYGHLAIKCNFKNERCCFCAGNHLSINCMDKNQSKCCNCIDHNAKYQKTRPVDHKGGDRQNCPHYQQIFNN